MNCAFIQRQHLLTTKKVLTTLCLLLVCFNGFGQVRYTWRPSNGSASWADGNNWNPARTTLAANDVLVFDGAQTKITAVTIDFAASQTIGQLIFVNGVQATLNTGSDRTLNLGAPPSAPGLQMDAGTLVQVVGRLGSSSSSLAMQLAVGTRAAIAGRLEFSGNASFTSSHTLLSATAKAIEFTGGSYFLSGTTFEGFPFGSLTANTESVVFRSGATFEQAGGRSPFGERTYAVTIFDLGSYYLYTAGGTGSVGLSGRMFGYLTVNANRTPTAGTYGANKVIIQNDLMILSGTHTFNIKELDLKGSILLSGGNLIFTPGATNSFLLTISGASAQNIGGSGSGTLTLGPNVSLVMNNPAGAVLQRPLQVKNLTLTQGNISTTTINGLVLSGDGTMPTGSATSFIDGPLSRLQTSTVVNLTFPIGSGKVYRPLTLTGQQADANPITYTAQQFNQAPTKRAMPTAAGSLQRVSRVRYFTVTNGGASNFTQGVIKLNYDVDDQVDMPAKLRIAKSDNAGNWLDLGGTGSGAPGGSITSTVAFTSFSDFVLASTEAAGGPGNNPLPVGLVSFTARRELAGVRLRWATATERNNKHFEVQRSTDGQTFAELKTVPGHGSSTAAQEYAWLDAKVEANALVYYRLRQVDVDNTDTYSPVVAVQASPVAAGVFPNPAYDRLNFHAAAGNTYRLLDMLGRPALMGKAVAGFNALNLNDLGPGIYHLEIVGAQGQVRYRVIKNGAAH